MIPDDAAKFASDAILFGKSFMAIDEPRVVMMVRDSRGVFTFEQWQAMPPEVPPPLKPWWRA